MIYIKVPSSGLVLGRAYNRLVTLFRLSKVLQLADPDDPWIVRTRNITVHVISTYDVMQLAPGYGYV